MTVGHDVALGGDHTARPGPSPMLNTATISTASPLVVKQLATHTPRPFRPGGMRLAASIGGLLPGGAGATSDGRAEPVLAAPAPEGAGAIAAARTAAEAGLV